MVLCQFLALKTSKILDMKSSDQILSHLLNLHLTFVTKTMKVQVKQWKLKGRKMFLLAQTLRANVRYKYYFGDVDSKGFQSVVSSESYGKDLVIENI